MSNNVQMKHVQSLNNIQMNYFLSHTVIKLNNLLSRMRQCGIVFLG